MPKVGASSGAINIGDDFFLPPVELPLKRVRCGYVLPQIIRPGVATKVIRFEPGTHRGSEILDLDNRVSCVVTQYRQYGGEIGALPIVSKGFDQLKWLHHPDLEKFKELQATGVEAVRNHVRASWMEQFDYRKEEQDSDGNVKREGLREPQIGALHAIGAHWTLDPEPALVVMPTGTGKTETMLAALIAHRPTCLLVIVPSNALRKQVAEKFRTLGILRSKEFVSKDVLSPRVGILLKQPKDEQDLEIFQTCNVVVATAASVAQGPAEALGAKISALCSHLVIDEAHHVAASKWQQIKEHFLEKPILQFTATPFREDGKRLAGKPIYSYSLRRAQQAKFFKEIDFESIFLVDEMQADHEIAKKALKRLRADIDEGLDHRLMARCNSIDRATEVAKIYEASASDLNPVLVHSRTPRVDGIIEKLRSGHHKVVICVNMLAEGFDLPELKVAAIHDTHRSLSVLLQFVGRFSRTSSANLGKAAVFANTARESNNTALQRLYSDEADWKHLLPAISAELTEQGLRHEEYLREAKSLMPRDDNPDQIRILPATLLPKQNAVAYKADSFNPANYFAGLPSKVVPRGVWHYPKMDAAFVVIDQVEQVEWSCSEVLRDHDWHLFSLFYDREKQLLFIGSSIKGELHEDLANAVCPNARRVQEMDIFRIFGNVNRLRFTQAGVKKGGGRKHRYSMLTGQDVLDAVHSILDKSAIPSNFSGVGYAAGERWSAGCSIKGKLWSRGQGSLADFVDWCKGIGAKLIDPELKPETILGMSMRVEAVATFPEAKALAVLWPDELADQTETNVKIGPVGQAARLFLDCDISLVSVADDRKSAVFEVIAGDYTEKLRMRLTGKPALDQEFEHESGDVLEVAVGRNSQPLAAFFKDRPPVVLLQDGSELEGALHSSPAEAFDLTFSDDALLPQNWDGINIQKESLWADSAQRQDSVQWRAFQLCATEGFDIVFDDDSAGEAADLVCLKQEEKRILVRLVHCKFSHGSNPGARIADVEVVAAQALRCARWKWAFEKLCSHLFNREGKKPAGRPTRFLKGDMRALRQIKAVGRERNVEFEILAVQPGVSKSQITEQQRMVLGSANRFLVQATEVPLKVWCST